MPPVHKMKRFHSQTMVVIVVHMMSAGRETPRSDHVVKFGVMKVLQIEARNPYSVLSSLPPFKATKRLSTASLASTEAKLTEF